MCKQDQHKCLIIQPIHEAGIACLEKAGIEPVLCPDADLATVLANIPECTAVITRDAGLSGDAMRAAPLLRAVSVHGAGYDPVDLKQAKAMAITVCTTPGTNTQSVVELTLALTFAVARRVPAADRAFRLGQSGFRERHTFSELQGKTAFVIGWGNIGQRVGAILRDAFGMKLIVLTRSNRTIQGADCIETLEDGFRQADLITLHTPLSDQTRAMIGAQSLSCAKPGAIIINTARAGLIDEGALAQALHDGRLAGAGLDLCSPEGVSLFAELEQVVLTPHLGGTTEDALRRTALAAADNVIYVLTGQNPTSVVEFQSGTETIRKSL